MAKGLKARVLAGLLVEGLLFFCLLHGTVFFLTELLPDAASHQLGIFSADENILNQRRSELGLTGSIVSRYADSVSRLGRLDFGRSLSGGYPIWPLVFERAKNSAPIWMWSLSFVLLAPLLVAPAVLSGGRRWPRFLLWLTDLGVWPQVLTAALIQFLTVTLVAGRLHPLVTAVGIAAVLPCCVSVGAALRANRELSRAPFVSAYLGLGLGVWQIRFLVLRNSYFALRPLSARLCLAAIVGSVLAEVVGDIPGLGRLLVEAVNSADVPVIQAVLIFVGALVGSIALLDWKQVGSA